ncbi:MAG: transposase [Patescibacteria group bacterium]
MTAYRRIQRTQKNNIKEEKLIVFFRTIKSSQVYLDAKHFVLGNLPFTFYLILDVHTRLPLACVLLQRYELRTGYDKILNHLKAKNVQIKAIISDGHKGLQASIKDHYPEAIHQRCAAHVLQEAYRKLGGRRFTKTIIARKIWPIMRNIALKFDNYFSAKMYLCRMKKKYPTYFKAFKVFDKQLVGIYQFEKNKELNIPRTSNQIENFMGFLEQRLKTMRGMKTPTNVIKILCSLIQIKIKKPTN